MELVVKIFLIYFTSFQMMFSHQIVSISQMLRIEGRHPADALEAPDSDDLIETLEQMRNYRTLIMGKEIENECGGMGDFDPEALAMLMDGGATSSEQAETEAKVYDDLLTQLSTNSCSQVLGERVVEEEEEECKPERQLGFNEKVSLWMKQFDEEGETWILTGAFGENSGDVVLDRSRFDARMSLNEAKGTDLTLHNDVLELENLERVFGKIPFFMADRFREGLLLRERVEHHLDNKYLTLDRRTEILVDYLDAVVSPFRDMLVVSHAYFKNNPLPMYELLGQLIPSFSEDIIRADEGYEYRQRLIQKVFLGKSPAVAPHYFEEVETEDGLYTLKYEESYQIRRDTTALMKSPTPENYVRALKWMTFHMMIDQSLIYKEMARSDEKIKIPNSCQQHFYAELPEQVDFEYPEEFGVQQSASIILDNFLIYMSPESVQQNPEQAQRMSEIREFFLESVDRDALKHGYSFMHPFEEYRNAKEGLKERDHYHNESLKPTLDDHAHFEKLSRILMPQAMSAFKEERRIRKRRTGQSGHRAMYWDNYEVQYKDQQVFNEIFTAPGGREEVHQFIDANGETRRISHWRGNFSVYMLEAMKRKGTAKWTDLIDEDLKERLKQTKVTLKMPSLYSGSYLRDWGIKTLKKGIARAITVDKATPQGRWVHGLGKEACQAFSIHEVDSNRMDEVRRKFSEICGGTEDKSLLNWFNYLHGLNHADGHVPLRMLSESDAEPFYPALAYLWDRLANDTQYFEEAHTNEYDLIYQEMRNKNPWARIRLSYLLAVDELEKARNGFVPITYTTHHARKGTRTVYDENSSCFYGNVDGQLSRLKEAAEKIGLNKSFSLSYGHKLAGEDLAKVIYQEYAAEKDEAGHFVLHSKLEDGKRTYEYLDKLAYDTILTHEQAKEWIEKELPFTPNPEVYEGLQEIFNNEDDDQRKAATFFYELYSMRGNEAAQMETYYNFLQVNKITNEIDVRQAFLELESKTKLPLYLEVLRKGAENRLKDVSNELEKLCNLDPKDQDQFKVIFHATSKTQNKLNELAGLPKVPDDVMDRIESMTDAEWNDMAIGGGSALIAIGAVLMAGGCVLTAGLGCAAIAAATFAAASAGGGLQVWLIAREAERKGNADEYVEQIKRLEELGHANPGSADAVSRSWFWVGFETLMLFPLLGIIGRAGRLSTRLLVYSMKSSSRAAGKDAFKQGVRSIMHQENVRYARHLLGDTALGGDLASGIANRFGSQALDGYIIRSLTEAGENGDRMAKELAEVLVRKGISEEEANRVITSIRNLRSSFARGELSVETFVKSVRGVVTPFENTLRSGDTFIQRNFGNVFVDESVDFWNRRTAKVAARYFGKNPLNAKHILDSYLGKRMDKALARKDYIESGRGWKIGNWFRKLRSESLWQNKETIERLSKELDELAKRGGDLEEFILENMKDFNEAFVKIPMRLRELPYIGLIQGSPSVGGRFAGSRSRMIGWMSDGIVLRRMFNARSLLVGESLKREARETLKLPRYVQAETVEESYKAFLAATESAASEMSEEEGMKFLAELEAANRLIVDKLHENITSQGVNGQFKFKEGSQVFEMDQDTLYRVIFKPENQQEEALGSAIWTSYRDVDDLLDVKELNQVAIDTYLKLKDYQTVGEFQRYLNAMKILAIQREANVVEYY